MLGVHEEDAWSYKEAPGSLLHLGPWAESKGPRISTTFWLPLSSDPESVPVLIPQEDSHSSVLITTGSCFQGSCREPWAQNSGGFSTCSLVQGLGINIYSPKLSRLLFHLQSQETMACWVFLHLKRERWESGHPVPYLPSLTALNSGTGQQDGCGMLTRTPAISW